MLQKTIGRSVRTRGKGVWLEAPGQKEKGGPFREKEGESTHRNPFRGRKVAPKKKGII